MFSICKETHPATGIEFSITCNFFNNHEKNIVVAGANILKVYRIIPDIDPNTNEKYSDLRTPKMRLECVNTYKLYGNVMSLKSITLSGSQRDALLISFRDAKLSVVQHDPDTFELKTLSLHFFEEEDIKGGWTGNYHIPIVRVDPDNRCAVMLVYGQKLVVLPFRRDTSLDEIEIQDIKPMKKSQVQLVAKTPILASYIISLKDMDEKIDNVIDIQFLHGYYESTLLILYEPVRTFPGRIAVRQDTCTMVAISLNIQQRVHPIIWSVSGLPYDCTQIIPIRKYGGCLIVSINALIYLNQSVPPYGVSLNSIADHSTNFPLKPQDGVKLSLDAAQLTFIEADKLVLSLKTGELYVLTLCADSMRNVRSFHFSKAASSVLTSCLCVCYEEYLFLGSRLGNSLLLRFTEKDQNNIITIDDDVPIIEIDRERERDFNPKRRLEEEELEVYGTGEKPASLVQLTSYTFEVCDSILNIAPIGFATIGERCIEDEMNDMENGKTVTVEDELEIVTASGHGKNGALCVLQNSIKPQIITSFGLSGFVDIWTVFDESLHEDTNHTFMILSQETSTMVLQTGNEINEIENTGFCNNQKTIHVGNLGNNRYIAQILQKSIRLLQGTRLLQNIQIDLESPFQLVSICDPYICLLTEGGQVITLALRETKGTPRLAINKNTISNSPNVVAISTYRDVSGLFTHRYEDFQDRKTVINIVADNFGYIKPEPNMKIEDEEDLLYGETGNSFKMTNLIDLVLPSKMKNTDWWKRLIQPMKPTFWLFTVRDNGNLEIYNMPDLKLVYLISNVGNGNNILIDSMEYIPMQHTHSTGPDSTSPTSTKPKFSFKTGLIGNSNFNSNGSNNIIDLSSSNYGFNMQNFNMTIPQEILMTSLGHYGTRPILFIRTKNEILVYRVYRYVKGHLKIRFKKLHHNILLETRKPKSTTKRNYGMGFGPDGYFNDDDDGGGGGVDGFDHTMDENSQNDDAQLETLTKMKYFDNVSGHNGVLLCGAKPYFIILTSRGELRVHRLYANISMKNFAAFNNMNCPNGLIYFDRNNELQIAVLPTYLTYDSPWPLRKVPLKCTPMFITYHKESKVYCFVTNTEEITTKYYRFNGEDKELTEETKGERFLYPTLSKFSVALMAPNTWEIIPDASIDLEPWEHVTSFKNVHLASEGTRSGLKEYICVGTNYNYSEDITSRGRVLIYDIIEVVPEPGKPLTRYKFKEIYIKEQKGPVSAITHVLGFLVTAVGQKVYLWQLKDNDLIGVAFIDTNIYVHQMQSIKSLILVADVYKSINLLRFQEEYRTLSLVSRDYNPLNVLDIEFIVDNANLSFIVSDSSENILVFMYQPESRDSFGGQKLLRKSDYHVGQKINAMFRVQCNLQVQRLQQQQQQQLQQQQLYSLQPLDKPVTSLYDNRHVTFYSTLDGGLGYCLPLPEKTYRRLFMLQNVLVNHIEQTCGLNPKSFRTIKTNRRSQLNPSRCIIDGELIWSFLYLPFNEKLDVAKKIGTRIEEIFSDLKEIDMVTAVF